MHTRNLFKIIVTTLFISSIACAQTPAKAQKSSTIRPKVEKILLELKTQLPKETNNEKRFKKIDESLSAISELRKKAPRQSEIDEIYFDIIDDAISTVPKTDFKTSECDRYRNTILAQFEPTAENKATNPAVKEAIEILDILCAK